MSKEIKKISKGAIVTEGNDACRLLLFCPDIEGWPKSWAGDEIDIASGRKIVEFIKPFLLYLLNTKLAPKTLHRHRDHMWMLGGEVIRRLNDDPSLRRKPVEKVTFDLLEEEGGPLIWLKSPNSNKTLLTHPAENFTAFFRRRLIKIKFKAKKLKITHK